MTLEELKQTILYKSLFEALGNDVDWPDIQKSLLKVARSKQRFNPNFKSVSESFIWADSPQGQDYWFGIDNRWREYEYNF